MYCRVTFLAKTLAHVCSDHAAKPFSPRAVASAGVDVLCPVAATARLDMLQPCRRLMRSVNLS